MTRSKLMMCLLFIILCTSLNAWGGPLKLFVPEFRIAGSGAPDEMKATLASLFASRIEGDAVQVVDSAQVADATAAGSYSAIGKIFSIDLLVRDKVGKNIARAYEQGESADDVIPAVGRLAQKIGKELAKIASLEPATVSVVKPSAPVTAEIKSSSVIRPIAPVVVPPPQSEIIRPDPVKKLAESGMIGQRLDGAMVAMAQGKTLPGDERELFLALEREIRLYRQGKTLALLAAVSDFRASEKILGIDSADLDGDGDLELYVTLVRGENLTSQVWSVANGNLVKVATDLPYFFRRVSVGNGKSKILAQGMGSDTDFQAEIGEVVKKGNAFEVRPFRKFTSPISIYTIGWIDAGDGKLFSVSYSEDGYLVLKDDKNEELWRSSDRFGGSEEFFSREDQQNVRVTGELYRKAYLDQRIIATANGELIVPRNEGIWTTGTGRSFSKNSIYAFAWNGAVLDERWHTRESRHYLADYFYDEQRKELVLLEVIKKDGIIQKGASAISIKKVD
jgi:hypothetical protein